MTKIPDLNQTGMDNHKIIHLNWWCYFWLIHFPELGFKFDMRHSMIRDYTIMFFLIPETFSLSYAIVLTWFSWWDLVDHIQYFSNFNQSNSNRTYWPLNLYLLWYCNIWLPACFYIHVIQVLCTWSVIVTMSSLQIESDCSRYTASTWHRAIPKVKRDLCFSRHEKRA